jgi:excisionase family DNA binding protein
LKKLEASLFFVFKLVPTSLKDYYSEQSNMNKKEAAELLGVSEKTVERYKSSGKLSARLKRIVGADGKSRKVLDFNQSDLDRLKRELSGNVVFPELTDGHAQTKTQTDTDRQTQIDGANFANNKLSTVEQTQTANLFEMIFKSLETISERNLRGSDRFQKLMLTVDEASAVSGLPKAFLDRAIKKDGALKATKIGGRYRIKRQDLDEFINNL